jgi:hypothetical protein
MMMVERPAWEGILWEHLRADVRYRGQQALTMIVLRWIYTAYRIAQSGAGSHKGIG